MDDGTRSAQLSHLVRSHPLAADIALAGAMAVATVTNRAVHAGHEQPARDGMLALGLTIAAYIAMLIRRRWALASAAMTIALAAAYLVAGGHDVWIAPAAAVALHHFAGRRTAGPGLPTAAVFAGLVLVIAPAAGAPSPWWSPAGGHETGAAIFAACVVALAVGDAARSRRVYIAAVEGRARDAELHRDHEAQRRVADERLRIARDLHDSIGHHLAVINAQAGMAELVFDTQRESARAALTHVKTESKDALSSLRATVGLLRREDPTEALSEPLPGIAAIADLICTFRRSGLDVDLAVNATQRPLPATTEIAAYRIVQESLTNVAKHSPAAATHVLIHYADDTVTVSIENDRATTTTARATANGTGHGLIGMHERAAAAGGHLHAAADVDGGYRVHATLPTARAAAQ